MTPSDIERAAVDLHHRAGYDPAYATSPTRIARGLGLRVAFATMAEPGATVGRSIYVRRGIAQRMIHFTIAHELGHFVVHEQTGRRHGEDVEAWCDALAAALLVPRPAFARAWREAGGELAEAAALLDTSQTLAALRLGEALRVPVAVVAPHVVRVRGDDDDGWPDEHTVRRWARGGAPAGLARVPITDRRGRSFLAAI